MLKPSRAILSPLLVAAALLFALPTLAQESPSACAASPKLVGQCFTVHGRLLTCNGFPGTTIWIVGSKRILGVTDAMGNVGAGSGRVLPGNLEEQMFGSTPCSKAAFGDYTVCPLAPDEPGVMRLVCVDRAARIRFTNDW